MSYQQIDEGILEREAWALRRQKGIPNNRRLMVIACMDERLPVEAALGLAPGDAHIFRNAGGLVTDDALRSAILTTNFFNYEVESGHLRRPFGRVSERVNTAQQMRPTG